MEFSKTKRFPLEPPVNAIGPGSYDILSPEAPYKHGAMIEKAGRFKEGTQGSDTFGLYDLGKENAEPVWKQNVAKSERTHQQMEDLKHRLTTQHEKDLKKLQSKLSKVEIARDELVKERNDVRNEVGVLKIEARASTARETALRASLDKSETTLGRHVKKDLQKQLEALTKDYSDSRKRKEVEIAELKRDVVEMTGELEATKRSLELEKGRSIGHMTEIEDLTTLVATTRSTLSVTSLAAHQLLANRSNLSLDAIDSIQSTAHSSQLRVIRLERQLSTTQAQVLALVDLSTQLDTSVNGLRSTLRERESQMLYLLNERIWERSQPRGDKEWRQRCRGDFREAVALNQEIELLRETMQFDSDYLNSVSAIQSELRSEAAAERKILVDELEVVEGELDLAINEEIPSLEEQVEAAEQATEDAIEAQATLRATLEHTEAILEDLKVSSTEMRESFEGELEEFRRRLVEKSHTAERLDKEKKRVASLLQQTRAAEQGLREELDVSSATLSRLPTLLARNAELHSTVDELQRRNASAEHDIRELEGTINEIDGNDNPQQHKIQMLSRVREDLKDSRRAHLVTTSQLASLVATNTALLNELNGYKSISVPSPDLTTFNASLSRSRSLLPDGAVEVQRSRVSRMILEEDEEEEEEAEREELFEDRRKSQARGMENVVVRRAGRVQLETSTIREEEEVTESMFTKSSGHEGYKMTGKMSVSELFS